MALRRFVICLGMLLVAITRCHCVALSKVSLPNPSIIWKFNSRGNSTQIKTKEAHNPRGRLFIGRRLRQSATLEEHLVDTDYQSDMGWDEAEAYFKAQADGAANSGSVAVQKLMQTEPNVECTGDSMKLNVQGSFSTPGALFLVDRGSGLAPLPLSELPSSCGYTLNTTQRDLVLVAPYDGCFVSLEEDSYVLSLHWWGIPVRMSCPVRRQSLYNPPRVTCNTAGMVVKTDWASPVDKIQVNLNGQWKPLMEVLPRCGFGFEFAADPASLAISIRYVPCVGVKDGVFTLGLAGDGAVKVSCPSVQIVDRPSKGVLPTVALLKYPNIPPAGTSEGQKQNSINEPPKAQVPVTLPPKNPAAPDNQHPQPYPFPYNFWSPHPSASQTPDPFPPYYQNPFYPPFYLPSLPDGPSQKPASTTSKTEGKEPVTQPKPPKTHDSEKPVGPEGQNPWPYLFPYNFWSPHPSASQTPDPFPPYYQTPFYLPSLPDGPSQKPASTTSKTEGKEPVTQPKPPKTNDSKKPVGPEGQNPWPYQFPYNFWSPHPSASQTRDPFPPYYQNPFYPPFYLPDGPSQKPASPTSKTEVQEPVTGTKPPKSGVTTYLPLSDPLATVTQTKPSKSKLGLPFNPLVQCPEKCLSGLSECCVSFNYHHHDHFIYPPKVEEMQGTPRTGIPDTIEASHDTIVNPPLQNKAEDWHNFLSQAVKYASKGNKVFAYSPPEGILNQDLPQSFEPSQSEWVEAPDKKQSQSKTPVNQGQFMILEPGMLQYNMFQDAKASSGDSTDYSEAVHPLSNSWEFEKRTSDRPFSNGYVLLEHGPPGSDASSPKLAARGLGRSHTHLASEPLSHYQQSKGKSHPPQPGNQMDAMYRSEDRMTGQEPHYYVPLSDPARIGQFQSNHNLGQAFKGQRSSVDGDPNGDVNQPFPRNGHGK